MSTPSGKSVASTLSESHSDWYADWQDPAHVRLFDGLSALSRREWVIRWEAFNDVRLLAEWLDPRQRVHLLEVGCATGEFFRYLQSRFPKVNYLGMDLSTVAIARAREKFSRGSFFVSHPSHSIRESLKTFKMPSSPEVVYCRDVLHHQTDPFEFLSQLVDLPSQALILRTRTRDRGETLTDPELSCQYHYNGWMPYLVFNVEELTGKIRRQVPKAEVILYRNHTVLGGKENRYLPKECYRSETGTAETAVGVFFESTRPGQLRIEDRADGIFTYPWSSRLKHGLIRRLSRYRHG